MRRKQLVQQIARAGDVLAIPFFIAAFLHYRNIKKKGILDLILLAFFITGAVADIVFTILTFC